MITCSRYCVSVGMTLVNLVLKLEKSSWWEKGQGSLLGCVGQTELVAQQLKQARKVSAVSLHPQSCVFLLRKSLLTSLCCSQNPHPFHFPPFPWSSVTCLYPTSHCLQQSCLNRSFAMCWCPQWAVGIAGSTVSLEPSLHLITAVPALCHQRLMPFIIAVDNVCKTRPLQDVRGYLAEGEKTFKPYGCISTSLRPRLALG